VSAPEIDHASGIFTVLGKMSTFYTWEVGKLEKTSDACGGGLQSAMHVMGVLLL
jgi:hypothetical protein